MITSWSAAAGVCSRKTLARRVATYERMRTGQGGRTYTYQGILMKTAIRATVYAVVLLLSVQAAAQARQSDSIINVFDKGYTLMHLNSGAGFVVHGRATLGSIPATGVGVRMMWFPRKWAFRAGRVTSSGATYWDLDNIGNGSVAFGEDTRAVGDYSFAMGHGSFASGKVSIAMGDSAISRWRAIAIGSKVRATADNSIAIGTNARSNHHGTIVLGDGCSLSPDTVHSTNSDQFVVRACGGYMFYTNSKLTQGVRLSSGGGSWDNISDVNRKENFAELDGEEVLLRLREVPVRTWNYKAQGAEIRHAGPTAQDFHAAFGLGDSDLTINTVDIDGINMAAVKALEARSAQQQERIEVLEAEVSRLRAELDRQRRLQTEQQAVLAALAAQLEKIVAREGTK